MTKNLRSFPPANGRTRLLCGGLAGAPLRMTALTVFFIFFLSPLSYAEEEWGHNPELPPGPLLLTSTTPDQLNPNYWISRLPEPNKLIKTPAELKEFNRYIRSMIRNNVNVFEIGATKKGEQVQSQLELEYKAVKGRGLFDVNDNVVPAGFFENTVKPVMAIETVPSQIKLRWGAATRATSVRALPTKMKLLEKIQDVEFDQLQFSLIKLWTPVAILHESSDGLWYYLQAPYTRGWVQAKDIAVFESRQALEKYTEKDDTAAGKILVVTAESIPIFSNTSFQTPLTRASMGTYLPLALSASSPHDFKRGSPTEDFGDDENAGGPAYTIWFPERGTSGRAVIKKATVSKGDDVTVGFLPYTQKNIILQAFKLLGARYGWGGMYHGRDCSAFTHDVFLTLGVDMPRGSKEQAYMGTQIGHYEYKAHGPEKTAALDQAIPGITLMRMPHHQMLYLGKVNGQHFAIHCTWAERYSMTSDDKNRINQVVVSDLTLNGRSHLGSLFDRIITISEIN